MVNKTELKKQLQSLGVEIVGNYVKKKDIEIVVSDYSGWTNWETWNVSLWISNEEGLYRAAKREQPFTEESAEAFVKEVYPKGTPDFESEGGAKCYEDVDWKEIVEAFNEF